MAVRQAAWFIAGYIALVALAIWFDLAVLCRGNAKFNGGFGKLARVARRIVHRLGSTRSAFCKLMREIFSFSNGPELAFFTFVLLKRG